MDLWVVKYASPSVQDRHFRAIHRSEAPGSGRFASHASAGQSELSAQGVEPDGGGSRPGSGHLDSVE